VTECPGLSLRSIPTNLVEVLLSDRALLSGPLHYKSCANTFVERGYSPGVQNRTRQVFDGAIGSLDSLRTSVNGMSWSGSGPWVGGKMKRER